MKNLLNFQIFIIWDPRKLEFPPTLMYKHETPITSFPLSLFTHQLISKTIKGCAQCTKLALLHILGEVIDRQTYPELPFLDMLIPGSQKKEKKKKCNSFFYINKLHTWWVLHPQPHCLPCSYKGRRCHLI